MSSPLDFAEPSSFGVEDSSLNGDLGSLVSTTVRYTQSRYDNLFNRPSCLQVRQDECPMIAHIDSIRVFFTTNR